MRILALDVGERRIGVAVSDPTATVARPVCTVQRASRAEDLGVIRALVEEHEAGLLIVGRPLTLRGEAGPQAMQIERYAQTLAEALPVPVRMWDERYSTAVAEEFLRQARKRGKRRGRGEVDAVAAAVILQGFLDSRTAETGLAEARPDDDQS
jgi:putative Holliday junction resolvase